MSTISFVLAVLSTLFFAWLGYKYQERAGEVNMPFATHFRSLLTIMLTMVFLAIAIALTLTL